MTEKRFYIDTIDGGGSVLTMNGVELGLHETCDLLNEQYEIIKQLQDENYGLKQTVAQLVKEAKETGQKKEKYNIQPYAIFRGGRMND